MRDAEEYGGVLELEKLLKKGRDQEVGALNENIRKSYSKFMTQRTLNNLNMASGADIT